MTTKGRESTDGDKNHHVQFSNREYDPNINSKLEWGWGWKEVEEQRQLFF